MSVLDQRQEAAWQERDFDLPHGELTDREVREGTGLTYSWYEMIHRVRGIGPDVIVDYLNESEVVGANVAKALPMAKFVQIHRVQERRPNGEYRTILKFAHTPDADAVKKAGTVAIMTGNDQHEELADFVQSRRLWLPDNDIEEQLKEFEPWNRETLREQLLEPQWHDLVKEFDYENMHGPRTGYFLTREIIVPQAVLSAEAAYSLLHS